MKIGVMSDTHGNSKFISKVMNYFQREKVEKIFHLGDNYEDRIEIEPYGIPFTIVPGIYDEEYLNKTVPFYIIEQVEDIKVVLIHSLSDLPESAIGDCKVIFFGHTHDYLVRVRNNGKLYINPGHLKDRTHKGRIATFCIFNYSSGIYKVKIIDIDFKPILEEEFKGL